MDPISSINPGLPPIDPVLPPGIAPVSPRPERNGRERSDRDQRERRKHPRADGDIEPPDEDPPHRVDIRV